MVLDIYIYIYAICVIIFLFVYTHLHMFATPHCLDTPGLGVGSFWSRPSRGRRTPLVKTTCENGTISGGFRGVSE